MINNKKRVCDGRCRFGNKKGLSEMVAYVLLIVIAISVSVLVYGYLKANVWKPQVKCDDNIALVIEDYHCEGKVLNLTVKNMGKFNIAGMIIRASNKTDGVAVHMLEAVGPTSSLQGERGRIFFNESKKQYEAQSLLFDYSNIGRITALEIEPTQIKSTNEIICESAKISQEIRNCN